MINLMLRRLGAATLYAALTIGIVVALFVIAGALSAVHAPGFMFNGLGIIALVTWVWFVIRPMMRTARKHAIEEEQIKMYDNIEYAAARERWSAEVGEKFINDYLKRQQREG